MTYERTVRRMLFGPEPTLDLNQPYVWSTTRKAWANSGCEGCEFHIPDASPETTALIARIDAALGLDK